MQDQLSRARAMSTPAGAPSKPERPQQFYINEHWDHCLDLTLRRVVYGGLAAGVAGLVLFRAGLPSLVSSRSAECCGTPLLCFSACNCEQGVRSVGKCVL